MLVYRTIILSNKKRKMKKYFLEIVCICLIISFAACKNEYKLTAKTTGDISANANIRIFNASLNSAKNFLYVNKAPLITNDYIPLTGNPFAYGGVFPSNNSYFNIAASAYYLLIKDSAAVTNQVPLNFYENLESGKYYTIFTYDTLTKVKYKIVVDNIDKAVPDTSARIRIANMIYSSGTIPASNFDLYSKKLNANIVSNISPLAVTDFIAFPSRVADSLYLRLPGSTTNINATPFVIIPDIKRSYTIVLRGSAVGGLAKTISSYINY
jgi:hypothetical protein